MILKQFFIVNLVKSSDLVLHWDISKEIGHRLSMVDPSNCLCKHQTDVYCLDFSALLLVNLLRNCIRHKQLQEKKIRFCWHKSLKMQHVMHRVKRHQLCDHNNYYHTSSRAEFSSCSQASLDSKPWVATAYIL